MLKYESREFEKKVENSKKISNPEKIESFFYFIDVNKEQKSINPTLVVTTASQKELMLQYDVKHSSYTISAPTSDINFKKIEENIRENVTNSSIRKAIEDINLQSKGRFISGLNAIEDFSEESILDIINSLEDSQDISCFKKLQTLSDTIKEVIADEKLKKNKEEAVTQSSSHYRGPQPKLNQKGVPLENIDGAIAEKDYPAFVGNRNNQINKSMTEVWRNLKYDKNNEIQEEIFHRFGEGKSIMLAGDTGVGKTFNPVDMAKKNNLSSSIIKLQKNSDSVDLIGKPSFRANLITGAQEMYFDYGAMSMAFKEAAHNAINFQKGYVLVLDEILRVDDMTPFISNLSVHNDSEYVLTLDESNTFALIETNVGSRWLHVTNDVDKARQTYSVSANGELQLNNDTNPIYLFNGGKEQAAERGFRGDLLSIYKEDYAAIVGLNRNSVITTHGAKTNIYCPKKAISVTATTNIGENYEVNMGIDNAFFSRFLTVAVKSPKISYMVEAVLARVVGQKDWTPSEQKQIKLAITNFATSISKILKNQKNIDNPQKINFRTIGDIIEGLATTKPLANGPWGMENVLKRSAGQFIGMDATLSAEEMLKNPIIDIIKRAAEKTSELIGNPAFKGISEEDEMQSAPTLPDDENESRAGIKI